jgi:hypothetical protein
VKHKFLLDMNILYYGVKGVDEHDRKDSTCAQLMLLIAKNCHSLTMSKTLIERYTEHLEWLRRKPEPALEPLFVMNQLILNAEKTVWELTDPPELPPNTRIPEKDDYIVRAALISRPWVVTCDNTLADAVNTQPSLNLRAIRPTDALLLAKET